jgi:hypothetical protein
MHTYLFSPCQNMNPKFLKVAQFINRVLFLLSFMKFEKTVKGKSPEVLFHGIILPYSYFEVI